MKALRAAFALLLLAASSSWAQSGTSYTLFEQTPSITPTPKHYVRIRGPKDASANTDLDWEATGADPCAGKANGGKLTIVNASPRPELRCVDDVVPTATPTPTVTGTPPTPTPTSTPTPTPGSGGGFVLTGGTAITVIDDASFPVNGQGPDFGDGNGQDDQDEKILFLPAFTPSKMGCRLDGGTAEVGSDHVFTLRKYNGTGSYTSTDCTCTITSSDDPPTCTDTSCSAQTSGFYYFRDVVGGSPTSAYRLSCYLIGAAS